MPWAVGNVFLKKPAKVPRKKTPHVMRLANAWKTIQHGTAHLRAVSVGTFHPVGTNLGDTQNNIWSAGNIASAIDSEPSNGKVRRGSPGCGANIDS